MALLEVENLQVSFDMPKGALYAVRGVSLSLRAGQTLAIVGESGSGKTVLCRNLMRLCQGNSRARGSIRLNGRELLSLSPGEMRRVRGAQMAYLFQEPRTALDKAFPIGAQIVEAILAQEKIGKKAARERALELLALVRLEEPERCYRAYPHELSGGMLQRAALCVALACRPAILIADEPTTALDATVQAEVLELLAAVQKELGMALLLITHDFGVAARLADDIAVMYAGKFVEQGKAREVLYSPRHPYTWALLAALPGDHPMYYLPGRPPELSYLPEGDAFAPRNPYALEMDFLKEPPRFWVSDSHWAATWLLHPDAPKIAPPVYVREGKVVVEEGYRGKTAAV